MAMRGHWQKFGMALTVALTLGAAAQAGKVYRWVDNDGVVHFGDSVPPEYAERDREVLNDHGVAVERQAGPMTPEERAEQARAAQTARELEQRRAAERARDETLLDTYISVEEIESLRDRRAEMLDGQIRHTSLYLEALREKLERLQADASRFRPYSPDPEAPPIHENLARELSDTLDSIIRYEKTLADTREQKMQLVAKFDEDIDRFRELKGIQTAADN
jgi:hypothetical protein